MKKILSLFIMLHTLSFGFAQNVYDSLFHAGNWRTYNTYLPQGYSPSGNYPLILAFHGGQQAGTSSQGWTVFAYQSELSQKADSEGFIVVYPEGLVINQNRSWNAGDCCMPAMNQGTDDIGFVDAMLNKLFVDYAIDTTRVYATGSSNGGMLCYRMACELSHRIAAIAPNACSHLFPACNPVNKVPVISFHSKADPIVFYNGGFGGNPILSNVFFPSQDSTLGIWSQQNQCQSIDTIVNGNGVNYDFIKVYDCACNIELHHYATTDGSHSWPGGNPNNNPVSTQISATDLLWSFFQNYTLGCLTTGASRPELEQIFTLYPNPAVTQISIQGIKKEIYYELCEMSGSLLFSGKTNGSISTENLPAGIYFLKMLEKDKIEIHKFIKK